MSDITSAWLVLCSLSWNMSKRCVLIMLLLLELDMLWYIRCFFWCFKSFPVVHWDWSWLLWTFKSCFFTDQHLNRAHVQWVVNVVNESFNMHLSLSVNGSDIILATCFFPFCRFYKALSNTNRSSHPMTSAAAQNVSSKNSWDTEIEDVNSSLSWSAILVVFWIFFLFFWMLFFVSSTVQS